MMDSSNPNRIKEIEAELVALERCPTYREWELLHNAYVAYIHNANDLIVLVSGPQSDPLLAIELLNPDPTSALKRSFHQELLRFLINYGATVSTLVDHSRNLTNRYKQFNTALVEEYGRRIDDVSNMDVVPFIQKL